MRIDADKAALGLIFLALGALSVWLTHSIKPVGQVEEKIEPDNPDYYIEHFTSTAINPAGRPHYRLSAEKLIHFPGTDQSRLTKPELIQYRGQQSPLVTTADNGLFIEGQNVITMTNNVHQYSTDGIEIKTDKLEINLE